MSRKTLQVVVVDTSVFVDYYLFYPGKRERHERARVVLGKLSSLDLFVYEPFLFEVELRGVLVRSINPERVLKIVNMVLEHVNLVREEIIHDRAAEIALLTGCRAVDAYYIAVANHVNGILITSDRVMKHNALRIGIETYCLLDDKDYKALIDRLAVS